VRAVPRPKDFNSRSKIANCRATGNERVFNNLRKAQYALVLDKVLKCLPGTGFDGAADNERRRFFRTKYLQSFQLECVHVQVHLRHRMFSASTKQLLERNI